jgi:hypothetical protein
MCFSLLLTFAETSCEKMRYRVSYANVWCRIEYKVLQFRQFYKPHNIHFIALIE